MRQPDPRLRRPEWHLRRPDPRLCQPDPHLCRPDLELVVAEASVWRRVEEGVADPQGEDRTLLGRADEEFAEESVDLIEHLTD